MLIVMIPTLYWIIVIELSCLVFQAGRGDALSFGQVRWNPGQNSLSMAHLSFTKI